MKHIAISIEYAGLTLPVVKNDGGVECVPMKPIAELFGLQWNAQHVKLQEEWKAEFLGTCITDIRDAAGQIRQMVCIRLDRVAAYLLSLNPVKIRAAGNESGAAFLKAKLNEWADALHDYETFGSAHNPRHADALLAMRRANAIANVAKIKDAALRRIALAELGINLDAPAPTATPASSGDLFQNENL